MAFPSVAEEHEILAPTPWFMSQEITNGLPDDGREADERQGNGGYRTYVGA